MSGLRWTRKTTEKIAEQLRGLGIAVSATTEARLLDQMIGLFKNNGRAWREMPKQVNDHDFRTDAIGVALPYGIYDVRRNTGMVMVGTTRETPAFAFDAIAQWWRTRGRKDYPGAERLLILADSGGANSARSRVWKCDL